MYAKKAAEEAGNETARGKGINLKHKGDEYDYYSDAIVFGYRGFSTGYGWWEGVGARS
jgi:hypothetical protein